MSSSIGEMSSFAYGVLMYVDAKVEGEPTIWVIANFSAFLEVMATSIIVGPSFKFGKLVLHVGKLILRLHDLYRLTPPGLCLEPYLYFPAGPKPG